MGKLFDKLNEALYLKKIENKELTESEKKEIEKGIIFGDLLEEEIHTLEKDNTKGNK